MVPRISPGWPTATAGLGCAASSSPPAPCREHTTGDRRLCLSRLPADAARLARVVRSHWAIENGLHWVLDVAMHQDRTRIRKDQAPDHLAVLHHIALDVLKQERTETLGIKNKRLVAGGDEAYVLRVLTASDI